MPKNGLGAMRGKKFASKINLNLVENDVFNLGNEFHAIQTWFWDFIRKKLYWIFSKIRIFSPKIELESWPFGKCDNFLWGTKKIVSRRPVNTQIPVFEVLADDDSKVPSKNLKNYPAFSTRYKKYVYSWFWGFRT